MAPKLGSRLCWATPINETHSGASLPAGGSSGEMHCGETWSRACERHLPCDAPHWTANRTFTGRRPQPRDSSHYGEGAPYVHTPYVTEYSLDATERLLVGARPQVTSCAPTIRPPWKPSHLVCSVEAKDSTSNSHGARAIDFRASGKPISLFHAFHLWPVLDVTGMRDPKRHLFQLVGLYCLWQLVTQSTKPKTISNQLIDSSSNSSPWRPQK